LNLPALPEFVDGVTNKGEKTDEEEEKGAMERGQTD
jgi:hypothetical protein